MAPAHASYSLFQASRNSGVRALHSLPARSALYILIQRQQRMRTAFKILIAIVAVIVILGAAAVAVTAYFAAPFIEMAQEIDQMNQEMEEKGGDMEAQFMALPESVAFVEKHPEYQTRLTDFGFDYEFLIYTPGDENTLRIDVDKESNERTITYNCTAPDGGFDAYMKDDLAARIPAMCR